MSPPQPATSAQINLTFHGIGQSSRRLGRGEANVWLAEDRFEAVLDSIGNRRDIRISFDDGNASDLEFALPALRRRGLRATFFVVAGRIGAPGFLDKHGIEALVKAGMTIGSHGFDHRPWRRLDETQLVVEMLDSRRRLEKAAGCPVTHAACPFGAYDRRTLHWLRRYGYDRVFTSDGGRSRPESWLQARNTILDCDGPDGMGYALSVEDSAWSGLARRSKQLVKQWR
jgi:peptidoglycan/xylan/chitin deacetylase (PgdA/CDA1 family)